jgi:hypothetical protein
MTMSAVPRDQLQPGEARPRILPPPLTTVSNGPSEDLRAFVATARDERRPTGVLVLSRTDCRPTKIGLNPSTHGLQGGSAPRDGASYRCAVPTKIVLRVHAEFARPTRLSSDPQLPAGLVARGRISTAYLAVATPRGRPIALTSVNGTSGKARLFTASSRCTRT